MVFSPSPDFRSIKPLDLGASFKDFKWITEPYQFTLSKRVWLSNSQRGWSKREQHIDNDENANEFLPGRLGRRGGQPGGARTPWHMRCNRPHPRPVIHTRFTRRLPVYSGPSLIHLDRYERANVQRAHARVLSCHSQVK